MSISEPERGLAATILESLGRFGPLGPSISDLVNRSVMRLYDSQMIIDDRDFTPFKPLKSTVAPVTSEEVEVQDAIEQHIAKVADDGLEQHFHGLIASFGILLLLKIADEKQNNLLRGWNLQSGGAYLMSDAGGPTLTQWQSVCTESNSGVSLEINKIWGIEAHQATYAIVVAATPGKPYPVSVLVPPDTYKKLERRSSGKPFLGGRLQLGDVSGQCELPSEFVLRGGGPAANTRYLCSVRPQFVRALMAHLGHLAASGRLHCDQAATDMIQNVATLSKNYLSEQAKSRPDTDIALALKFLSNEVLVELATGGNFVSRSDARDALAFAKMEGSSYRCLYEIFSKRFRRG